MSAPVVTAGTTVEELRAHLRENGHDVPVYRVPGPPAGDCTGCDTNVQHPAVCVVNVVLHREPLEPRPGGWTAALCRPGLAGYLTGARGVEGFNRAYLETQETIWS